MNKQTVTPNRLMVVKGQMAKFLKAGVKLPEEIKEIEKHLFHVIIITDINVDTATLEVKCKSKIQNFDSRSWIKAKDQLGKLGLSELYIFHDPTIKEVEAPKASSTTKQTKASSAAGLNFEESKAKRTLLIARAVELGYDGSKKAKDVVFEEFIEKAEAELKKVEAEIEAKKTEGSEGSEG